MIHNHTNLPSEYVLHFVNNHVKPYSINGINVYQVCSYCHSNDNVRYTTVRRSSVCNECASDTDVLIDICDVDNDMSDLSKWVPVVRDSEHNLILHLADNRDRIGLSSINSNGDISYISFDGVLSDVLKEINDISISDNDILTYEKYYNTPIRMYMSKLTDYITFE